MKKISLSFIAYLFRTLFYKVCKWKISNPPYVNIRKITNFKLRGKIIVENFHKIENIQKNTHTPHTYACMCLYSSICSVGIRN